MDTTSTLTDDERRYLGTQRLGRLATVDATGAPQNNPVGFAVRDDGSIVISGFSMGATRKFRNVAATGRAAFVVDDIASLQPWAVRGVEVRGHADAVTDVDPPEPWMSREQIVVHPDWVHSWGIATD